MKEGLRRQCRQFLEDERIRTRECSIGEKGMLPSDDLPAWACRRPHHRGARGPVLDCRAKSQGGDPPKTWFIMTTAASQQMKFYWGTGDHRWGGNVMGNITRY